MSSSLQRTESRVAQELQISVALHSLGWLFAANFVGVWLALLLVRPEWGRGMGEFTYGRWMPLHLNWQLYGWCSIPWVGLLLRRFLPPTECALIQAQWALRGWTIALAVGGWSWLHGQTSGKLFLDWSGFALAVFVLAQVALWMVLAGNYYFSPLLRAARSRLEVVFDSIVLASLASVPVILFWATERHVHPPVDPTTGGPTGASLLGSTLVIVLIFGLLPKAFEFRDANARHHRIFWSWFGIEAVIFGLVHGAPPFHADWRQIGAMASLLVWVPLVPAYLRGFPWAKGTTRWLAAVLFFWTTLLLTGFTTFLPGLLDAFKFTHVLVAHAHLAMAGLLTSMNFLILGNLSTDLPAGAIHLGKRIPFVAWQGALLLHLAALLRLGMTELKDPAGFYYGLDGGAFVLRFVAGAAMAAVSAHWFFRLCTIRRSKLPFSSLALCGNRSF